ncbi:hypothetical protein Tco_0595397 [Tanacetum coccineum]
MYGVATWCMKERWCLEWWVSADVAVVVTSSSGDDVDGGVGWCAKMARWCGCKCVAAMGWSRWGGDDDVEVMVGQWLMEMMVWGFKFATKILLHEINVHSKKILELANEFDKVDSLEGMAIIVEAIVEQENEVESDGDDVLTEVSDLDTVIQNAVQNLGVQNVGNPNGLIVVLGIANQNPNGNGNIVAARAEGDTNGNDGNQIMCYNCRGLGHLTRNYTVRPRRRDAAYLQTQLLIAQNEEAGIQLQAKEFDLMATATNLDEIEEVNANCILMANLKQASTSSTQTDKAPVYDSDGSAEVHKYDNCYNDEIFNMFTQEEQYTELLEPIPEPYQVQQNDSNVISEVTSVEQEGGTVEQHSATVEETRAYHESLFHNLAAKVFLGKRDSPRQID